MLTVKTIASRHECISIPKAFQEPWNAITTGTIDAKVINGKVQIYKTDTIIGMPALSVSGLVVYPSHQLLNDLNIEPGDILKLTVDNDIIWMEKDTPQSITNLALLQKKLKQEYIEYSNSHNIICNYDEIYQILLFTDWPSKITELFLKTSNLVETLVKKVNQLEDEAYHQFDPKQIIKTITTAVA